MGRVQTAKKVNHTTAKQNQKPPRKEGKSRKPEVEKSKGKALTRPKSQSESLRAEILALGGDEEDYELVKDVDRGDYALETGNSKTDATLSKDLDFFMKGLDFSFVRPNGVEGGLVSEVSGGEEDGSSETSESEDPSSGATSHAVEQSIEKKEPKQNISIPNARLLLEPTPQWYTLLPPLPPSKTPLAPPSPQTLSQKQPHASSLHSTELTAYENATSANKLTSSSSEAAFLQKILASGTLSDRLSALTLLAQSSPVHNTRALETLRNMSNKKGREESLKAVRAVCDWWVGGGAPDRKLKYFIDQPLNHPGVTDKHLLLWFFEDWLKKYFYSILQTLETLSLDPLPYVRLQAMGLIFTLLRDKPEQEQNLLRLLVNKLGDSERSVASRASYHLLQLLQAHPSMKSIVVREVYSLVLKPSRGSSAATTGTKTVSGAIHLKFTDTFPKPTPKAKGSSSDKSDKKDLQQEHSRYYASITLNQIMLSTSEADQGVAKQLISLYFELFKEILGTPAKLLDGSERGDDTGGLVDHSRYAKEKRKKQEEKKGKGKELAEREGFAELEDSNSKLTSAILTGVNRALPFAKLSLEDIEFSKHIDTLFLISHKSTFNISLQALRLILQICQSLNQNSSASSSSSSSSLSTSIADRYYRSLYASLQDTRLNSSNKHAMYLNLLLKSLKVDTRVERVKAFVRRFVQLLIGAGNGGAEFVAGGLYLLGELFKAQPVLQDLLGRPRPTHGGSHGYDPKKRDPQYANAGSSPIWELLPLLSHYHPTVRLHASRLLSGTDLTANADLSLNTLSHFLDRFVYKNPKKPRPKGSSAMQPASSAQDGMSIRIVKGAGVQEGAVVNDESFWRKNVKDVPVDQVFFHKYFSTKNEKERAKAEKVARRKGDREVGDESSSEDGDQEDEGNKKGVLRKADSTRPTRGLGDDEGESESESEGEREIWKAMQATNPDLNPDIDDDLSSDDSASGDDDESEVQVEDDEDEGEGQDEDVEDEGENEDGDNDEALSLAEASDAEDLVSLADVELPEGLIPYDSSASSSGSDSGGEWTSFDGSNNEDNNGKKRKRTTNKKQKAMEDQEKQKRRKLRSLPTFATYEDYAKLIEGEPEDNI